MADPGFQLGGGGDSDTGQRAYMEVWRLYLRRSLGAAPEPH